jgi:hypothetical protein
MMKEKITLKQYSGNYRVVSLENRADPRIGDMIDAQRLEDLLFEARLHKNLTIKIT